MRILSRSHVAVRHLRMLLIRAGLSEADADAFLDRLEAELVAGHLEDQEAGLKFIERQLAEVRHSQRTSPGRIELLVTQIGIVVFVEYLKALSESDPPSTSTASAPVPSGGYRVHDQAAQARFTQQGPKLVGTGVIGSALQGSSVSLSSDGNTAIVGGLLTNAAWVYTRSDGVWSQQAMLVGIGAIGTAFQGRSVALSGDGNTAIVGGPVDNRVRPDNGVGAVWVFTRSGGVWSQQGPKLVAADAIGKAGQGSSVSLSSDGNTAIVGGPADNDTAGAAWVYTRTGGLWSQQAKLVDTAAEGFRPQQGLSVSLSRDGNTAIVGGVHNNREAGPAWVYTRSDGVWSQQAKLVATNTIGPFGQAQGISVSLSGDGNTAIVGGGADNNSIGAAWVFTRSDGVWSQQAKLVGTDVLGSYASQGSSVSLSGDGNTATVGGSSNNSGADAVWVFTRSGGIWSQQTKLVGIDAISPAAQGSSVSLSNDGNTVIVGGLIDNNQVGAAWVFA
jgi:hypothetical protein